MSPIITKKNIIWLHHDYVAQFKFLHYTYHNIHSKIYFAKTKNMRIITRTIENRKCFQFIKILILVTNNRQKEYSLITRWLRALHTSCKRNEKQGEKGWKSAEDLNLWLVLEFLLLRFVQGFWLQILAIWMGFWIFGCSACLSLIFAN